MLGKVVQGTLAADLKIGMEMEFTTMTLYVDDDGVRAVPSTPGRLRNEFWDSRCTSSVPACTRGASGAVTSPSTAWWPPVPRCATPAWTGAKSAGGRRRHHRNGYPGFVAGATFAQKLGWNGIPVSLQLRGLRPQGAGAAVPRPDPGRVFATSPW